MPGALFLGHCGVTAKDTGVCDGVAPGFHVRPGRQDRIDGGIRHRRKALTNPRPAQLEEPDARHTRDGKPRWPHLGKGPCPRHGGAEPEE